MRSSCHSALVAAALLAPAVCWGEPAERVAFEWVRETGADTCADRDELARRVAERLAREVFVERDAADTVISGTVRHSRRSPRWRATLALSHAGEARDDRDITSDAPSCRPLEDAVVLFLGLLLVEPPPPPAPPESPSAPPSPSAPEPAGPVPATPVLPPTGGRALDAPRERTAALVRPRQQAARPWMASISVGPVASLGLLPGLAGGVRIAAQALSPYRVSLQIAAIALAEQDLLRGEGRTRFSAQLGGIGLCPTLLEGGALAAGLCGGLQAGWIRFDASGYAENHHGSVLFGEAFAGTWLSVQVWRWLRAGASAGAAVPFWRWPFEIGAVEVHRMAPVAGVAEAHAAVRLP